MTLKLIFSSLLGVAIFGSVSCAIPGPTTAEKKPAAVEKKPDPAAPVPTTPPPQPPTAIAPPELPDNGIRMPDMLAMPTEAELRSTPKLEPKLGETGAVVSRPPPSEVKKTE